MGSCVVFKNNMMANRANNPLDKNILNDNKDGIDKEQKEKKFQTIHFLSLFVFVFFGVIILIMLSNMDL